MEKGVIIGITGHIERSLPIEAGIAPMELSIGLRAALVDIPGHTDFILMD